MQVPAWLTRRKLVVGIGGLVTAAAGSAAASPVPGAVEDVAVQPRAVAYGPVQTLMLGAIDFQLRGGENPYTYMDPGGVALLSGFGMFGAGLRLAVGVKLVNATLYVKPNGHAVNFAVKRYNPLLTTIPRTIVQGSSTTGSAAEAVSLSLNHVIAAGWNYRLDNILMGAGQAVLLGARVLYLVPK